MPGRGSILILVTPPDEMWSRLFAGSSREARDAGRSDLADLIDLKATNDEIRSHAITLLARLFVEVADRLARQGIAIEIEPERPHRFSAFGANLVGTMSSFRHGVRCLTVAAGWTRLPGDGFMRGGALAFAQIRHFGLKKYSMDLALLKIDGRPIWHRIGPDNLAAPVGVDELARHLAVLVDQASLQ